MSETQGAYSSVTTSDGYQVVSNHGSADEIKASFDAADGVAPSEEEKAEKVSEAASELGKRGAKAAAEKRAAEAKAKPESDEPDEEPEPEAAQEKPLGKPRHDPRARMLEATRKEAEAKRQLAEERAERQRLAAEVEEIKARMARPAEREQPKPAPQTANGEDPEPQEDQFDNYRDFVKAQARWEARQEFQSVAKKAQEAARAEQFKRQVDERLSKAAERMKAHAEKDPTFSERLSEEITNLVPSVMVPPGERLTVFNAIADEIVDSESGPALMSHLSDHPEEFQRLAALTSQRALAREVAKLEARLEVATTATNSKPVAVSKAFPPVRPVTGNASDLDDDEPTDSDPYEVWKKKREAQVRRERKAASAR